MLGVLIMWILAMELEEMGEWIANNSDLQSVIGLVWSLGDTVGIKETNRLKFKFAFILSDVRYPPK